MRETITFEFTNDDGDEDATELPAKFEVCTRCRGRGTHTNPNIDGNGITSSEWAEWAEEEREHYLTGVYDVPCEACHGDRVVLAVDEEACKPELLAKYHEVQASLDESRRISRMERMAEMGRAYFDD